MDWKNLFLSANGRIGQKDFWIGWLIVFVANILLSWIPVLGLIIAIALIYAQICIYSKRLHDMGKTGWLAAVPFGASLLVLIVAGVVAGASIAAMSTGAQNGGAGMAAAMGSLGLFVLIIFVINIGFLLWLGLTKGDLGPNQYGPPPMANASTTF